MQPFPYLRMDRILPDTDRDAITSTRDCLPVPRAANRKRWK